MKKEIGMRLNEESIEKLKELAKRHNRSNANMVEILIEAEYYKNNMDRTKKAYENLVEYAKGNKTWNEILIPAIKENYTYSINENGTLMFANGEGYVDIRTAKMNIDSVKEELCGMSILERKLEVIKYLFI